MAEVRDLHTVAGSNTDLFPEGVPAASINNNLRELEAALRRFANSIMDGWFQFGTGSGTPDFAVLSGTQFRVTGGDFRTQYAAGRRVRAIGNSTGTIVGTIGSSAFSGGNTTVTVAWDSGALATETVRFELGPESASQPRGVSGNLAITGNISAANLIAPVVAKSAQVQTGRSIVNGTGTATLTTLTYQKRTGTAGALLIEGAISCRVADPNQPSFVEITIGSTTVRQTTNTEDTSAIFNISFKAIFTGLAAGSHQVVIKIGKTGIGAFSAAYNPTSADQSNLPSGGTISTYTFEEF